MRRPERRDVGSMPTPAGFVGQAARLLGNWWSTRAECSATEVIRPDEEPVLRTGGGDDRLGVRVPRLPLGDSVRFAVFGVQQVPTEN